MSPVFEARPKYLLRACTTVTKFWLGGIEPSGPCSGSISIPSSPQPFTRFETFFANVSGSGMVFQISELFGGMIETQTLTPLARAACDWVRISSHVVPCEVM